MYSLLQFVQEFPLYLILKKEILFHILRCVHYCGGGEAATYKQEADERIAILNEKGNISELSEFTVRPHVLYFDDITEDEDNWKNQAVANWYGKEKVIKK